MSDLQDFISEIKRGLVLPEFISSLGIAVDNNGKINCPFHNEKTPSCVIYPTAFKCFGGSCGEFGDFIDFFMGLYPNTSFLDAVNAGAEFVGVSPVELGGVHSSALQEASNKFKERKNIEKVYEATCQITQEYLFENLEVQQFAWNKWGFNIQFLKKKRIGYLPKQPRSLASRLLALGITKEACLRSGLFYQSRNGNGLTEVLRDRILFPYIIGGTPRYFIGRTPRSDQNDREQYPDKIRPKYQKLATYNEERRPYISRLVENCYLYGEDVLHDKKCKIVIITEGIADAMSAERINLPVVSPVTTRLRTQDLLRYLPKFKIKECIYIANDNEKNKSGEKGAISIAEFLEDNDCYVRIVDIPKPDDVDKIDLNDFIKMSPDPEKDVEELLRTSKPPLLKMLLDLDPNMDEMERTKQIFSFEDWWRRVSPADIPTYVNFLKNHFKMNKDQSNAILSQLKEFKKPKKKTENIQTDKSSWSLKDLIDDHFENPQKGRIANKIADEIYEYLKSRGAQFYSNHIENEAIIFHDSQLYPYKCNTFRTLIYDISEISKESSLGRQVFDCLNQKIQLCGHKIDMFSWIYTTRDGKKYLNLSGDKKSKIVCFNPEEKHPTSVSNGRNKDKVILCHPFNTLEFTYDPDVDIDKYMKKLKKLVFNNFSCNTQDKYMILSWALNSFFVDKLGTRPHLRFEGTAGSGKTTAAKMITTLFFGRATHQNASTMAAIYETARTSPIVCLDNIENKNLDDRTMDFIIASATRASRHKKGGSSYNDIIEQSPQCMVMTTGIEPLHKNELIQRTLVVNFYKENRRQGFLESRILDQIKKHRDGILSALLKIAFKMYKTIRNYDRYTRISEWIAATFPDNPKERNSDALCHMMIACWFISRYIQERFEYDEEISFLKSKKHIVGFDGEGRVNRAIFKSWISTQSAEDNEVNVQTSEIVFFLERLLQKAISYNEDSQKILEEYGVEIDRKDGVFYIIATASSLHAAFAKLAKEGTRYTYDSPMQLVKRIQDSFSILNRAGWLIGLRARRTSRERFHVFAKTYDSKDVKTIKAEFKNANWN